MTSANPSVNALHAAYCGAMGIDLEMTPPMERNWCAALQEGIGPDDVRLVLHDRRKRVAQGVRHKESMMLRNLVGSADRIADLLNETAVLRSVMRVKVENPEKVSVLKATGRATVDPDNYRKMSEVIEAMRKAAK